jgi:cyclophilin family peptidyl-prolyl cis-trans isomerase
VLARLTRSQYAFPAAILGIAAIAGIVVLIASSSGDGGGSASACEEVAAPQPKNVDDTRRPDLELERDKTYTATVDTNCGQFVIELDTRRAPETSASFVALARDGFYDGLGFHRVIPDFMIQGGCPKGDGTGGPGYQFEDEVPSDGPRFDRPGLLAMANAGPNTNGSQFFVTAAPTEWLTGKHTIFGEVTQGYEVVEAISKVSTGPQDRPITDVVLERVEIAEG